MEHPENISPLTGIDFFEFSPRVFSDISTLLKTLHSFNIGMYKDKCIKRRIAVRIRKTNCFSAEEYVELLRQDKSEVNRLIKVLTIHTSHFFRNLPAFEKLTADILPGLFSPEGQYESKPINILSVGCAGGEEPYTLALIIKEYFDDFLSRQNVSIIACDIDHDILEFADKGVYGEDHVREIPPEIIKRWFRHEGQEFHLAQEIKDMVTFRTGDLFDLANFPRVKLILCRNVLIYVERCHQEKIIRDFAGLLGSGGFLMLGKAETLVGNSRRLFQSICP